jgi:hypothetical protein
MTQKDAKLGNSHLTKADDWLKFKSLEGGFNDSPSMASYYAENAAAH